MGGRNKIREPIPAGGGLYFGINRFGEINPRLVTNLSVAIERLRLHGVKMELANAIIQECYGFAPAPDIWDRYFMFREGWARVALWKARQKKYGKIAEVTL